MTMRANAVQSINSLPAQLNSRWSKRLTLLAGLILVDVLTVLLGFRLAYVLRFESGFDWFYQHETSQLVFYQHFVFFLAPIWIIIFTVFGLYDFKHLFSGTREYALIFNASTFGILLVILFTFFESDLSIARFWVIFSWVFVTLSMGLGRFTFRRAVHQLRIRGYFLTNVLIIGANEEGQAIAHQLKDNHKAGIKIVGFLDDHYKPDTEPVPGLPVLGTNKAIVNLAHKHNAREVILVSTALNRHQLLSLVQTLHNANIPTRLSSGLYEMLTTGVEVQEVGNVPLLTINKMRLTGSDMIMKRALDLIGAASAIILFSPIMMLIAFAVKLDSRGPIIYRRRVVGASGKLFDAFKFRTMTVDADARLLQDVALRKQFEQNYKLKDDPRVTRIGRFLRRTSLDELPQLFNVLLGQMSLVGPRMITDQELTNYGKWSLNLSTVKPGITGLWQVSGRSDIGYNERVNLDMQYIRNYSIWLDLYLLWQTVPAVLKSRGAY